MTFNRTLFYLAFIFTASTTIQCTPHHRQVEDRLPDPRTAALSRGAPAAASGGALGHATPGHLTQHGGAVSFAFATSPTSNDRGGSRRGRQTRQRTTNTDDDSRGGQTVTARPNHEHERLTGGDRDRNRRTRTKDRIIRAGGRKEKSTTETSSMAATRTTQSPALAASSSVDLLDAWGDRFISVAHDLASALADDPSSVAPTSDVLSTSVSVSVSVSATPADATATPLTTNALDVLQSALPSEIREGLESVFPGVFGDETTSTSRQQPTGSMTTSGERTNTRRPNGSTSTSISTSRPTTQTTRRPGDHTNEPTNNRPHPPGFTNSTWTHSPTTISTSTSTSQTTPPTTTTPTPPPTDGPPPPDAADQEIGAHPIPEAAVAGIASGLVAGAVVIFLGGAFLYRRRRQQGKPFLPFNFALGKRQNSQRSGGSERVYPEVAWLYDPVISRPDTPSAQHTLQGSEAPLVPGAAGPSGVGSARGVSSNYDEPMGTPEMGRGRRAESPLLAPQLPEIRVERDESPFGERGGGGYLRLPGRDDDQGA